MTPAASYAAGLTSVQIQSILSLLSAFGADSATIANVTTALNGGTPSTTSGGFCHRWNTDLTVGSTGADVTALNQALTSSGIDTTGNTSFFSENNAGDVVSFQSRYGIRQTGYVGPMTRAKLNALYGCGNTQQNQVPAPTATTAPNISSLSPSTVIVGGTVTVYGSNLNSTAFSLDGVTGLGTATSDSSFTFIMPSNTSAGTHTLIAQKTSGVMGNSATIVVVATSQTDTPATTYQFSFKNTSEFVLQMAVKKVPLDLRYDINKDGKVTSADALAYLSQTSIPQAITDADKAYVVGLMSVGTVPADLAYDINKDGKVTSADALAYLKLAAPAPIIQSIQYFASTGTSGERFTVMGENLTSSSELQYTDTLNSSTNGSGQLTHVLAYGPSQIAFAGNTYTGNVASVYKITLVDKTNGSVSNTITVDTRVTPTPTVMASISASPTAITAGQSTTLSWSSTNATSCTISATNAATDNGAWGMQFRPSSGSTTIIPYTSSPSSYTAKYQIVCTGATGTSDPVTATVTVSPSTVAAAPILSSLSPSTVLAGGTVVAYGSNLNNTAFILDGAIALGTANSDNSYSFTIPSNTSIGTHKLTVKNASGANSTNITVAATADFVLKMSVGLVPLDLAYDINKDGKVTSADALVYAKLAASFPTVSLSAYPKHVTYDAFVAYGGQAALTWSSTNATSCKFTEGDPQFMLNENTTSGTNKYTQPLFATKTYTLSCTGAGGTTTKSVTVTVESPDPYVTGAFSNNNSSSMTASYIYQIKNYRSGLVLDVEPTVDCTDSSSALDKRDCSQYWLSLSGKAAESYVNVQGNPYVKGGASYRFTGSNGSLDLKGFFNPSYIPVSPYRTPVPNFIFYKFILRDLNQGGATIWSKTELVDIMG